MSGLLLPPNLADSSVINICQHLLKQTNISLPPNEFEVHIGMGFGIEEERPWKILLAIYLTGLSPNVGTLDDLEVNVREDWRVCIMYILMLQPASHLAGHQARVQLVNV